MFHTHVANICSKCFICFKCMLHSSVSCCKCGPPSLVSMRVGRAKPWGPTCGGGAGHPWWYVEEAQVAQCCCERGMGQSSGWPGRDGRRADVEEAGVCHPSSVGSRSEAGNSDANTGNGAITGGARIRVNGAKQPRAFGQMQASGRPGTSAADVISHVHT
jgi:hypothetical protein